MLKDPIETQQAAGARCIAAKLAMHLGGQKEILQQFAQTNAEIAQKIEQIITLQWELNEQATVQQQGWFTWLPRFLFRSDKNQESQNTVKTALSNAEGELNQMQGQYNELCTNNPNISKKCEQFYNLGDAIARLFTCDNTVKTILDVTKGQIAGEDMTVSLAGSANAVTLMQNALDAIKGVKDAAEKTCKDGLLPDGAMAAEAIRSAIILLLGLPEQSQLPEALRYVLEAGMNAIYCASHPHESLHEVMPQIIQLTERLNDSGSPQDAHKLAKLIHDTMNNTGLPGNGYELSIIITLHDILKGIQDNQGGTEQQPWQLLHGGSDATELGRATTGGDTADSWVLV